MTHSNGTNTQDVNLVDVLALIRGGRRVIAWSLTAVLAVVLAYILFTKPVYESTARIMIDFQGKTGSAPFLDLTGLAGVAKITNEIETLSSLSLAKGVAGSLLKEKYLAGEPRMIIPILLSHEREEQEQIIGSLDVVAGRVLGSVTFASVKESDVIKISARSTEPREAALIANTYARVHAEENLSASRQRSRSVREFLQGQMEIKQRSLDSAETVLKGYMQNTGVVSLDAETNSKVEQLAQLEANRDALEIEVRTRSRTLESYKQELAAQEPNIAKAIGESSDSYIRILQDELARLEVRRDMVIAQNPSLNSQDFYAKQRRELEVQIATLRKNLQERTQAFLSTISPSGGMTGSGGTNASYLGQVKGKILEQQIELDGLEAKRAALSAVIAQNEQEFGQIPKKAIELAKYQRARLSNEKLYLMVEEKYNEAAITEKSEFGSVVVIDPGKVPEEPVSPKVWLSLVLGVIVGFGLGAAIVLLRSAFNVRVRAPDDLKQTGIPILSVINRMEFEPVRGRRTDSSRVVPLDMRLVAHTHRGSPLIEAYRRLYTSLQYEQAGRTFKSILVTSLHEGEGKSTVVSNLAIISAEAEKRVLLVDADLRRPTLHGAYGVDQTPGLAEVLGRRSSLVDATQADLLQNLDFLSSGKTPPNPGAVLRSDRMQGFLHDVGVIYDLLLLDSPPLFAVTDAFEFARLVDAVVLVTSAGGTKLPEIERALEVFGDMRHKVVGLVLNNFNPRKSYRAASGSYGYGYGGDGYSYYASTSGDGKTSVHDKRLRGTRNLRRN